MDTATLTVFSRYGERLLLRPEEAAEIAAVGRNAIYEAMRTGELNSIKLGKSRRIEPDALAAWIASKRTREENS